MRLTLGSPVRVIHENVVGSYLGFARNRVFVDMGCMVMTYHPDEVEPVSETTRHQLEGVARDAYKRVMSRTTTMKEETTSQYGTGPGTKSTRSTTTTEHETSEDSPAPIQQYKAPPGMEETVKGMKKHPEIDNPWALAWWMKNKEKHGIGETATPHEGRKVPRGKPTKKQTAPMGKRSRVPDSVDIWDKQINTPEYKKALGEK